MEAVFLKVLNMSITASYLVLAVILARLLLKKAPKFITVILWGLVAVRLICPFSLSSVLSLVPSGETVPVDIMYADTPQIYSGISSVNTVVNNVVMPQFYPDHMYSANPLQIIIPIVSVIWVIGIAAMLLYMLISYIRIRLKVREAVGLEGNIYECDRIDTPFILGVIKPKIYLSSAMAECDREYVIAHERAHLKRRDHLWKPLGFLLLMVYWFNPILWVAYILLCRDIELACDEKVIRSMGEGIKKPYSDALINCSVPRKMITACPVAFGETGVKGRIKSVLNYKKPAFWVIIVAVVLSIAVAVCFMTNPYGKNITAIDDFGFHAEMFNNVSELTVTRGITQYSISYEEDISEILKQLEKVRVRKDEISKSRDKNRDKTNAIVISEQQTLYFNENFSEIWCVDSLKPSFSYKILNPKSVEKVFDIISNSESNRINTDVAVANVKMGTDLSGVTISVKEISLNVEKPFVEIEIKNDSENRYTYGETFSFYYKQNGDWVSCLTYKSTETRKRMFTLQAIILMPNSTNTKKYALRWHDLSKTGEYRLETDDWWIEFELKTAHPQLVTDSINSHSDKHGVDITVKQLELYGDSPCIKIELNNQTNEEYWYGEYFKLLFNQDGEYVPCDMLSDHIMNDLAWGLLPNKTTTHTYDLSAFDFSKEGKYRFERQDFWVEFEVKKQPKQ